MIEKKTMTGAGTELVLVGEPRLLPCPHLRLPDVVYSIDRETR